MNIAGVPLSPLQLYGHLLDHYGPQGWWPTTPPGSTVPVYDRGQDNDNLTEEQRWEIIVGAVLTQNTAWRNVTMALTALSEAQSLALPAMAAAEMSELSRLIRPSRYYNQKARRLGGLAVHLLEQHQGKPSLFLAGTTDLVRCRLLALPGIGPETADSILLYADHRAILVIDAYTRRIATRIGLAREGASYVDLQALFMDKLPGDADLFNQFHALLVRHAATFCTSRPRCERCCVSGQCREGRGRAQKSSKPIPCPE